VTAGILGWHPDAPASHRSPGSPTANARYSRWWPKDGPTARSPSGWSSPTRRPASTAPASSPSSTRRVLAVLAYLDSWPDVGRGRPL